MPDLVFVSLEDWDEIWRRNQFLCSAYAKRHPSSQILFVCPAKDVSNRLRRGRIDELIESSRYRVADHPNIAAIRPLKLWPNSIKLGRELNERLMRHQIRRESRRLKLNRPVLWVNDQSAVHLVGKMASSAVIYDVTDDWTQLSQQAVAARLARENDAALCRLSDAVIVCSSRLHHLKSSMTNYLHLIPNGVDADHYAGVLEGNATLPEAAATWRRPILGYTGTVHPERIDLDLLSHLGMNWPGSVVTIGPSHLTESDANRLANANVIVHGSVPYSQVPKYMAAFDVCIVPHRVTPFTESLNPIKLWEYLAGGKPIVATDVAGFRDYPSLVSIARTPEQFLQLATGALREKPEIAKQRRDEARRHSWASRLDAVEDVISDAMKRRAACPPSMQSCS